MTWNFRSRGPNIDVELNRKACRHRYLLNCIVASHNTELGSQDVIPSCMYKLLKSAGVHVSCRRRVTVSYGLVKLAGAGIEAAACQHAALVDKRILKTSIHCSLHVLLKVSGFAAAVVR